MASTTTTTKAEELPEYYSFPPFFTLQPVVQTRKYQLRLWRELVLRWHQVSPCLLRRGSSQPQARLLHD